MGMPEQPSPYLVLLGDTTEANFAKTAFGLRDWARDRCIGEWLCGVLSLTTGMPRMSPVHARERGARSMVIGVANFGGFIQDSWVPALIDALEAGLDLVAGMHAKLHQVEPLRHAAQRLGRQLIDVRVPPANIPVATGST